MSRQQRIALRKRKERNQKVWWYIQDTIVVAGLFAVCYALLFVPLIWSIT